MPEAVYVLCALTSFACAVLLLRSYLRTGTRMLLWSSLCFVGLAANNLLLFVDLALVPSVDLSVGRALLAMASILVLLVGLVGDAR